MSKNRTPSPTQTSTSEKTTSTTSTAGPLNEQFKDNQSTYSYQSRESDYWKSPSESKGNMQMLTDITTTQAYGATPMTVSSGASSSRSPASSTRGGSSFEAGGRAEAEQHRKSSVERAMDKARSKLGRRPSGAESLAADEAEFERQKAKEIEKQRRKEEYERLGLGDRTKFGMPGGAGGWQS